MRTTIIAAALAAVVVAKPLPQDLAWDVLDTISAIPTSAVSASGIARRSACVPQPTGAGPATSPDTVAAFAANPVYASAAAQASTPAGYTNAFTNLNASNNAYGYLGYTTLNSYDTALCSSKCDAIVGCEAFNIYFERDPSVDPNNDLCPNPSSTINIKCVFWGGPVSASNANNFGQWRAQYQVAIAGSNGYVNNSIATPSGYVGPTYLGNAAINALSDCNGANTYMGYKLFQTGAFDVSLCAAACSSQTQYNVAHPPTDGSAPMTCQFFNTYILLRNGTNVGQYCSMYNQTWALSTATNVGQYRGYDKYTIAYSYAFSNASDAGSCHKSS